jgi:hypothetical protein
MEKDSFVGYLCLVNPLSPRMKKWLISGIVLLAAACAAYYYVMNKPHRSIGDEDGIAITADSLFDAFAANEQAANAAYLNKVLRVKGKVKAVDRNTEGKQIIVMDTGDLMFGINCTMDTEAVVAEGDEIEVKGICTGYLADVVINQAIRIDKPR